MSENILWDCHMHSSFSGDSETPMEEMARQAYSCGMEGICFTEHLDPDYPNVPDATDFSLDVEAYRRTLDGLREAYAGKLDIRFGIELGLQPQLGESFHDLLKNVPFDFVIGSSHVVHGYDPYYPEFFRGRGEAQCYREYFSSILENLKVFDEMDVYGHLDYVVRYGPNKNRDYSYESHQDVLDEILITLLNKNVGLEVNTGGYSYGLREPNPCTGILRRYRELGGEIITVGADAHTPGKIGAAFPKARKVLQECGFKYYTVFKGRRPEFIRL